MIPLMYSRDDVIRRLHGTAAIYEGEVYFVCARNVPTEDGKIKSPEEDEIFLYPFVFRSDEAHLFSPEKVKTIKYTNPNLIIKGVSVGYCNLSEFKACSYVSRCPVRSSQLGLHPNNVVTTSLPGIGVNFNARVFYSKEMKAALKNEYPNFYDVLPMMKNDRFIKGTSFSKEFCLSRVDNSILRLDSRGVGIAISVGNNDGFIPLNNKQFKIYEEELTEHNIKIN